MLLPPCCVWNILCYKRQEKKTYDCPVMLSPEHTHTHTHTFPLYAFIIQEYGLCGREQIASLSDINVETQQIEGRKMRRVMRSFNLSVTNAAAKLSTEFTLFHPLMVVRFQQTPTNQVIKTPLKPSNV